MDKKEIQAAVERFKKNLDTSLKGGNVREDIQKSVWIFLKELKIEAPVFKKKEAQ